MRKVIALIPAYDPDPSLVDYVIDLLATQKFPHVVIVNDGSKANAASIFDSLSALSQVAVLRHVVRQGKGAALKTGLNEIASCFPGAVGVVTIDADGQHTIADACHVRDTLLQSSHSLILGSRQFEGEVPCRSALGNIVTRHCFRWVMGLSLKDTQSGLRGIPMGIIKDLLQIKANGYEFELDMLMRVNQLDLAIIEVPIQTIYLNHNYSSHFRPIWDSLKIYFVLLRFSIIAVLSAVLDYVAFISIYYLISANVFWALMGGRIVSMSFNYLNVRRYAFRSRTKHGSALPKYLALALFSGLAAGLLIASLINLWGWRVVPAKVFAEAILFVLNFVIQRDFIFRR